MITYFYQFYRPVEFLNHALNERSKRTITPTEIDTPSYKNNNPLFDYPMSAPPARHSKPNILDDQTTNNNLNFNQTQPLPTNYQDYTQSYKCSSPLPFDNDLLDNLDDLDNFDDNTYDDTGGSFYDGAIQVYNSYQGGALVTADSLFSSLYPQTSLPNKTSNQLHDQIQAHLDARVENQKVHGKTVILSEDGPVKKSDFQKSKIKCNGRERMEMFLKEGLRICQKKLIKK